MDNSFYIFFTAILAVSIVVWRFFPKFKFFIWISKGSLTQIGVLILIIILIGISFHLLDSYGHGYGVGNYTSASPVKHFFNSVSPEALYLFKNNLYMHFMAAFTGYILLSGLFITTFVSIFHQKQELHDLGKIEYKNVNDHYVIIGGRFLVGSIIRQLRNHPLPRNKNCCLLQKIYEKKPYIMLLTSEHVPTLKERLRAQLSKDQFSKVIFIHGGQNCKEDIKKLNLKTCREIYVLGENNDIDRDGKNINTAYLISQLFEDCVKSQPKKTVCKVMFDKHSTYELFQRGLGGSLANINFEPFCFYKDWVEKIFASNVNNSFGIKYFPLDRVPIVKDSKKFVHLIIIGMSKMGITMAEEAAHFAHFPNFSSQQIKTRITLIDKRASEELRQFRNSRTGLFREVSYQLEIISENKPVKFEFTPQRNNLFTDIFFNFIQGDILSSSVRKRIKDFVSDENAIVTIAVRIPNPADALNIGLNLPSCVYDSCRSKHTVPVLVQQETVESVLSVNEHHIPTKCYQPYKNVFPFGMLDEVTGIVCDNDRGAQIVNYIYSFASEWIWKNEDFLEENKEYLDWIINSILSERDKVENGMKEYLKNKAEKDWEEMNIKNKFSNRYSAASVEIKLRSVKISPECFRQSRAFCEQWHTVLKDNANILASTEHNRWNMEKLLLGFVPTSDTEHMNCQRDYSCRNFYKNRYAIHDAIRPFHELGIKDRVYDYFFVLYCYLICLPGDE